MNIVLLSGGSGKRLWPLSNEVRSKQFIQLFHQEGGEKESMVQRVRRQILSVHPDAKITIAAGRSQLPAIRNQLGEDVHVCVEPDRRDTFPAMLLAAAYLRDVAGCTEEEAVVFCPVDPYVDEEYFRVIGEMSRLAEKGESRLTLMGIAPTYPSEKYGYILPEAEGSPFPVRGFHEKPSAPKAEELIAQGALWNGGVFACRIGYILEEGRRRVNFTDYYDLYDRYGELERISFDHEVAEHESSIQAIRCSGLWKDLGTWNTFSETMAEDIIGNGILDETCEGVQIVNELDLPILGMGLKDVVIAASPDGILVADKDRSSHMKPYVDRFDDQVRYAEKSWGSYKVIDETQDSLTIRVTLKAGSSMNYHSHQRRDEVWTVVSGKGMTVVDGMRQEVSPGDIIAVMAGCRHTFIAETECQLIEVQLGTDIDVADKTIHEME